jgi:hypothetical protein
VYRQVLITQTASFSLAPSLFLARLIQARFYGGFA